MASRPFVLGSALILAACGGSSPSTPDAGAPDAGAPGAITVTVYDESGQPAPAQLPVFANDASGALLSDTTTDAHGQATLTIPPGASVTAMVPGSVRIAYVTVRDAQPGDTLVLGVPRPAPTTNGVFTVAGPPIANAVMYYARTPCGEAEASSPSVPVALTQPCTTPGDVELEADDQTGAPLAYASQRGVALAPGGSFAFTELHAFPDFTVTYTGIDPGAVATLRTFRQAWIASTYWFTDEAAPTGATMTLTTPADLGPSARVTTRVTRKVAPSAQHQPMQDIIEPIDGAATTYSIDVGAAIGPWLDAPTFDLARRSVHASGATTSGDLAEVEVFYSVTSAPPANTVEWDVYGPDLRDLTLPQTPPAATLPTAADTGSAIAFVYHADDVGSYGAIRAHAAQLADQITRLEHDTARSHVSASN